MNQTWVKPTGMDLEPGLLWEIKQKEENSGKTKESRQKEKRGRWKEQY